MKSTMYFGGKKFEVEELNEGRLRITREGSGYAVTTTQAAFEKWQRGAYIQHAMPDLSPDEREFLISGLDPDQWKAMFGDEPDVELE